MPRKPHLRLYCDGNLYLWRGELLGWKHIGHIEYGTIQLHRISWPAEFGKYIPK